MKARHIITALTILSAFLCAIFFVASAHADDTATSNGATNIQFMQRAATSPYRREAINIKGSSNVGYGVGFGSGGVFGPIDFLTQLEWDAEETTLLAALALKAPLASPTFTGTPAAPTASAATSTTQIATTAFVTTADNLKANIASPTFTGTPAAPTAAGGTNTTQLATTAFVTAAVAAGVGDVTQAELDAALATKAQIDHSHIALDIADSSAIGRDLLTATDQAAVQAIVGATGSGDVSAASSFGTDNRVVRSDGTSKGVQASAVTIDDSGNISGLGTVQSGTITSTGAITGSTAYTTRSAHGAAGSTETIDAIFGVHSLTLDANLTITISNWPASGTYGSVLIAITQDSGTARTISWPAGVGTAPDVNQALSSITWVRLWTIDGGTTVYATSDYYADFTANNLLLRGTGISFEGSTDDTFETSVVVTDPTADRVWTIPNVTDTFVGLAATQTLTNKTLTTPVLGVATATSINKVAITAPATSATLTIADGKTLTASNTITLAGTDGTTQTFPTTSGTVFTSKSVPDVLQAGLFAADAGANDTYVATLSPAITGFTSGVKYRFKANTANTGAATINFNSLGAVTIKKVAGGITTDLSDNDIRAGQWVEVVYDGTNMQMTSASGNAGSGTGDVTAASSFGTDNRILRADGTGKGAQASAVTIDDSGNITGLGTVQSATITSSGTYTGTNTYTTRSAHGAAGATETIDALFGVHSLTLDANLTITVSNWPASGTYGSVLIGITQDGTTARTITWPGGVVTTPDINSALSSITWVQLWTIDGGTTVYASGDYTGDATASNLNLRAAGTITLEGATDNAFETTLTVTDPTADRTWTFPDVTDSVVGLAATQTLTNKTLTSPTLTTPALGVATATSVNKVAITAPATSATLTIPDGVTLTGPASSGTAATLGNTETITGIKTFGSAGAVGRLKVAGTTSGTTTLDAAATASGTVTLPAATDTLVGKATTDTLTNKTFDAAATGNVLSHKQYAYLTHPHLADGTGATLGTTTTAIGYGHATFSNSADEAANYVEYYFQVPEDLDTSVALRARLKVLLGGADTATQRYVLSSVSVADSAVPTSSTLANSINIDYAGDASGASGDVETSAWTTLTSWAGALTAGQTWRIRLARDGNATQDASTTNSTELGLVIEYTATQ